jgi:hypothetical protein
MKEVTSESSTNVAAASNGLLCEVAFEVVGLCVSLWQVIPCRAPSQGNGKEKAKGSDKTNANAKE